MNSVNQNKNKLKISNTDKIYLLIVLYGLLPPFIWLFILWFTEMYSASELQLILMNPVLYIPIPVYTSLIIFLSRKIINNITNYNPNNDNPNIILKNLIALYSVTGMANLIYPAIGTWSLIPLINSLSLKSFIAYLMAFPTTSLFTIPAISKIAENLENWTAVIETGVRPKISFINRFIIVLFPGFFGAITLIACSSYSLFSINNGVYEYLKFITIVIVSIIFIFIPIFLFLKRHGPKQVDELMRSQRDLAIALSSSSDLDSVLNVCLKTAINISNMESGGIYLVNDDESISLACSYGLSDEFIEKVSFFHSDSLRVKYLSKGEPIYSNSREAPIKMKEEVIKEDLKFLAIVPIKDNDKIIASLNLATKKRKYISKESQNAIELISNHIGSAIQRARVWGKLKDSEEKIHLITEASMDILYQLNIDGEIEYASNAAKINLGYTPKELLGNHFSKYIYPDDIELAFTVFADCLNGKSTKKEIRFTKKNGELGNFIGSISPLIKDGKVVKLQGLLHDITEIKRIEEEMSKTSKIESLGVFAGGIAHDFNNLLTAIIGNHSLAKNDCASNELLQLLSDAENASLRAKDLTGQLLTFSKGGAPIKKITSINTIIEETVYFTLRGSKISSEIIIEDNLWNIDADSGQMNQMIHNIIINSIQAMPQGGKLIIRAENVNIEENENKYLDMGIYIVLKISDQGYGINESDLDKIFDPFYTTKPHGTGLGLSIIYSIVKKHGGHIEVESILNKGTDFTIYLPAIKESIEIVKDNIGENAQYKGRVLLMDDEEMILNIGTKILKTQGFDVETAYNGDEAVQKFLESLDINKKYDFIILDLTIPGGTGGKETSEILKKIDPEIKLVVSSGYSNDPVMANYQDHGFSEILVKPYAVSDFNKILNKLFPSNK